MQDLPLVVRAEHKSGFLIHLEFSDGTAATVDFERWLEGPMFEPLRAQHTSRLSSLTLELSRGQMELTSRQKLSIYEQGHQRRHKYGLEDRLGGG